MAKGRKKAEREVKYDHVFTEIYDESNPLTYEKAMELLDYQTEEMYQAKLLEESGDELEESEDDNEGQGEDGAKKKKQKTVKAGFGDDYDFKDMNGDKVRCLNNNANRHFQPPWAEEIAQDILNANWRLNGETIIIGKTGRVNSGQHRLIGLIFAYQKWSKSGPKHQWVKNWPEPPVLHTIVAYGLEETSDVTRTLDNVRKRTLADVLFADNDFFRDKSPKERVQLTKITDYAVKFLWSRTGHDRVAVNAYAPRKTHSEAVEFLEHHPTLKDYVVWIFQRYQKRWKDLCDDVVHPGFAAGLAYLMATSATEGDVYRASVPPKEGTKKKPIVDWGNEAKAKELWTLLTADRDADETTGLRIELKNQYDPPSREERLAYICRAWRLWLEHGEIPEEGIDISDLYVDGKDGVPFMFRTETCGGIDLGPPEKRVKKEEGEGGEDALLDPDLDPDHPDAEPDEDRIAEMELEKQRIKEEHLEAKRNGKSKKGKGKGKKKGSDEDTEPAEEEGELVIVGADEDE